MKKASFPPHLSISISIPPFLPMLSTPVSHIDALVEAKGVSFISSLPLYIFFFQKLNGAAA
jgi:hypothetical protein